MKLKLLPIVAVGFLLFVSASFGQGIIFKIPDGVLAQDWNKSGFKGILMLKADGPAGVFVASPNEGETMDQLRERAAKFIAPMVSDAPKDGMIPFDITAIAANSGDSNSQGSQYLYSKGDSSTQILFFTRKSNGTEFLYGHFGSKPNKKKRSDDWMEPGGEIPKLLQKLHKTFKEK